MSQMLDNLRQKSEAHRRRVAALTSSAVMLVIVAIWVTTFPARFPELANSQSGVDEATNILNNNNPTTADNQQPINAVSNNMASGYTSLTEALSGLGQTPPNQKYTVSNGVTISDGSTTPQASPTAAPQDPNQVQIY